MAVSHDYVGQIYSRTLVCAAEVASAADDIAGFVVPVNSKVVFVDVCVQTIGTGTGSDTFTVENKTDSEDILSAAVTCATAGLAVEGTLSTTAANLTVEDGDIISLNADSVHGTTGPIGVVANIDLLAL